jgi:hypothetical protein
VLCLAMVRVIPSRKSQVRGKLPGDGPELRQ